ncbi:MAG: succinate dehydrogenase, cytochrome b556 subunit [Candidatus Omnitrophota bacterium]|nr:succinate dehydrogenase, cytochrome b556 subunit [Candidatus Omnitrophota bacterium]
MSLYKGGTGQWSWALHRLTGVGVLLFLFAHILDTALIILGPTLYNKIIAIYRLPLFGLAEIGLFAAVLYHSFNGVRICIIDFWPAATRYHKQMWFAVMALFFAVFLPVAWIMTGHILQGASHG